MMTFTIISYILVTLIIIFFAIEIFKKKIESWITHNMNLLRV